MKIIKRYVIPIALILFSLYLILSQYKREQVGLFTIIRYFDESNISGVKNRELLAGEKVTGIFTATENNLGTVSVRFNTFWRINDDWLIFRIKSVNDERWFYENKYKVDQFQNGKMFPFGFPELKDSSKKTYVFEIESTQGITDNAIAVSGISPAFHVRYRFPKETIIKSNNFEGISSVGKILKYNLAAALMTPAGAILGYIFRSALEPYIPIVLSIAAGSFIYISISDLIPELRHKTGVREFAHILIMILGIFVIWFIGSLLPE